MLPTGHEGPYSLETLEKRIEEKKLAPGVQVWREGLPVAISLRDVLSEIANPDEELPPPLPPLPTEDDEMAPPEFSQEVLETPEPKKKMGGAVVAGAFVALVLFGLYQWIKQNEVFEIRRYPKMTLELHSRIQKELKFEGLDKKLFFHEFSSPDLTHIWLVTTGFQRCDIEAVFRSVKDRLLTMKDEEVELVSRGKLSHHVAELNVFEFRKGSKIIPGLYEMDVKATRCEWEGIVPKLRNIFDPVEQNYSATMRVVLYPQGPDAFQETLTALMKKKEELKNIAINQKQVFWDELQMKFQTLHAMTIQIEQHFLDFLDNGIRNFHPRLKMMVNQYTKKYGQQLTRLVIDNESFFSGLKEDPAVRPIILQKDYEGIFRTASKSVGLESMKVIEKLQTIKKPAPKDLTDLRPQVLKTFEQLKVRIEKLLLGVTEDRSKSP
jgi:hypothetical protein